MVLREKNRLQGSLGNASVLETAKKTLYCHHKSSLYRALLDAPELCRGSP